MRISEEDGPSTVLALAEVLAMRQIPALTNNVGPGWWALVMDLHMKLVKVFPSYQVGDMKEKFGGLRVYLDHYDDRLQGLIDATENMSFRICERCGHPGSPRCEGRFWILTLCDQCDGVDVKGPLSDH